MINARLLKHSATEVSSYTLLNICTFYFRFGQVPLWSNYYLCSSHTSGGIAYIYSPENRGGRNFEHFKTCVCIDR